MKPSDSLDGATVAELLAVVANEEAQIAVLAEATRRLWLARRAKDKLARLSDNELRDGRAWLGCQEATE